jgi:hypothetical protein
MSMNLPALFALFPEQTRAATRDVETRASTTRGPCRYDPLKAAGGFTPDFAKALDAVRADPRWGPVYRGDLSSYGGDHSRADLALCGEFARLGLRAGGIDTALRTSGLYRDKWERDDYRDSTIARALTNTEPKADDRTVKLLDPQNGRITISTAPPAPRDYTLEGLLVPAKSAVLAGFGGVSKTQLALQLAIAVALGNPFVGKAAKRGKVIVILGEEDRAEINRRLSAAARYQKLDSAQILALQANILAYPLVGCDARLTAKGKIGLTETAFATEIIERATAVGNVRRIVLDHMGLIHGGDFNAREDAALTMRVVNHVAQQTGASVMVLAHTPKSANQLEASDASMVAGSTAFVDQARAAWVMATMRETENKTFGISAEERKNYVSLMIPKNNYGPTGDVYWFRRVPFDGVGFLEFVNLTPQTAAKAVADLGARIVAFVAEHRGQYSKTRMRDTQSGKSRSPFKASKADVDSTIEMLIAEGQLVSRPPTEEERDKFGNGPRVTHVLDVGAPGMTPALPTDETKPPEARSPPGGEKPPRRHRRRGK